MPDDNSDETLGWDDGALFASGIHAEVQKELDTLRKLKYSEAYIDAWKASAESIFYNLTTPNNS
jgi:hypothetical protein